MADSYKNTADHPVDLDDGSVVGAGEWVDDPDTRGPVAKDLIESGVLVAASAEPPGQMAAAKRRRRRAARQSSEESPAADTKGGEKEGGSS